LNPKHIRALIALNAALLIALGIVSFSPKEARGDFTQSAYVMLAGQSNGATGATVYIIDTQEGVMLSVQLEPRLRGTKELVVTGVRELSGDFREVIEARRAAK